MSVYDKYQKAWSIESGLQAGKSFLNKFAPRVLGNPAVRGVLNNPVVRVGGGAASKLFSLPAQLFIHEVAKPNPWGDKNSAMYGKGPGSLEYAAAIERANAAGRNSPIEEDYLITPAVEGSTFTPTTTTDVAVAPTTTPVIDLNTNSQANETAKGLEKYGFDENFALTPKDDGTYGVVRSEVGKKADAFLDAKEQWLQDTSNSPAAQAGVFSPEERWQTHLNNQQWRRDKGRSFKHGDFLD